LIIKLQQSKIILVKSILSFFKKTYFCPNLLSLHYQLCARIYFQLLSSLYQFALPTELWAHERFICKSF